MVVIKVLYKCTCFIIFIFGKLHVPTHIRFVLNFKTVL